MKKQLSAINPNWIILAIGIAAVVAPMLAPPQLMMRPSGRLLAWPFFAFSVGMMGAVVWFGLHERKRIAALAAIPSFVLAAVPIVGWGQNWPCVLGECYW